MDFHTGPDIPAIGSHFDPELFADTLQAADVNSVTLFAKCHHGHLYYETSRPERHPNLACDLLPQQITALRERGIRCPIYLSIQCDEYAA
ncbi:MAG: beta-galactosidase, partial [Chthoniobacterales bacterium]